MSFKIQIPDDKLLLYRLNNYGDNKIYKEYSTISEIANFFKCSISTIQSIIERNLIRGTEYITINRKDFKENYEKQYNLVIGDKVRFITLITKEGIIKILLRLRGNVVAEKIKEKTNYKYISHRCKQDFFLDELEDTLKCLNITGTREYRIDNYRIDFYIPSLNLAIEYDEKGHMSYSYEQEEGRQKNIEKKLKCKFIRLSENDSTGTNIGKVLKEVVK